MSGGLPDLRGTLSYDYDNKGIRGFSSELAGASDGLKTFDVNLKTTATSSEKTAGALSMAGAATGAVTVALGAVTAAMLAGVSAAVDYNKSVTLISTLSAETEGRFAEYEAGILSVSAALGQDAVTSANAAYNALSSGIEAGDAIGFLETSSIAAAAGITTVDTASSALTVTLNSYNLSADQATAVSDALFATANVGVTTFDELATSFGGVASISAAANASYEETLAVLGQITTKGTNTRQAVTELKATFTSLSKPTADVAAALEAQGFASAEAAIEANGLQYVMELVRQTSADTGKPLIELVGSVEAVNAILKTTGENGASTREKIAFVGDAAGSTAAAFDLISETPAHKIAVFRESLDAAGITLGRTFLPLLTATLDAFTPFVVGATRLAEVVGGALAGGFEALPAPVRLVIGALTGLTGVVGAVAAGGVGLALALSPLLDKMNLLDPATKLAQGALSKLTGSATSAGSALKAAAGPIGAVVIALALLAEGWEQAGEAIDAAIEPLQGTEAGLTSYAAAIQRARDESSLMAKAGFAMREEWSQFKEESALGAAKLAEFGSKVDGWTASAGAAARSALGLADAERQVGAASSVSTQSVIQGAQAWLEHGTNMDPAILKSQTFLAAQARLRQQLEGDKITTAQYEAALLKAADAESVAAGTGLVLTNLQANAAASIEAKVQATLRDASGLSEATLASDAFQAVLAQQVAATARSEVTQEDATAAVLEFGRAMSTQDGAYQDAISGNQKFDAAYKQLIIDFEAGRMAPVEAIAEIQRFGLEAGVSGDKVEEATGRILASTAGISDTLKNAGFQLDVEAVADPDKRAEVLAQADADAANTQRGIFAGMLAARKKLETDLAAAAAEGGQSRAAKVASTNQAIAEAEAKGNTDRANELRAGLAGELAELDTANANRLGEIRSSFEEERAERLKALAQSAIDQLNARLQTGEIGEQEAMAVFGAIKAGVPDASFIDPATEGMLRFNAAIGDASAKGGATAENLLRVRDSFTQIDQTMDTAEGHVEEYGNAATAEYERVVGASEGAASGITSSQGAIAAASDSTRGAIESDSDAEIAALEARQRGHEELATGAEGALARQADASTTTRGVVTGDSRAVAGALTDMGDAGEGAGRRMAGGAVVARKTFTAVPGAIEAAATGVEAGMDGMVGAVKDGADALSSVEVDVSAPFDASGAAARGATGDIEAWGRQSVGAAEEVASAQASSAGDQVGSIEETQGAVTELKGAYEEVPADVETEVLLDARDAESTLDYLLEQIAQIDGKTFSFKAKGGFVGDGNRMEAGSPLLLLQDLWAIQSAGNSPFTLRGAFSGAGLMGAAGGGQLGLKEQLDAIYQRAQQPVVVTVDGIMDPGLAAFLDSIIGSQGVVSSAVRVELGYINQQLEDAQGLVDALGVRIDYLMDSFLRGGAGEEGSLAWLMGEWSKGMPDFDADLGGLFSDLNLPVDSVEQFADLLDEMAASDPDRAVELWNRFYDGIMGRQDEYHAARMAAFEAERAKAEANFELDKRRIEELTQKYEEENKKSGEEASDNPQFEGFSDEVDRLEDDYAGLLSMLGFDGEKALHDFYRAMTKGARDGISNNEDLAEAFDLLGDAIGDHWDGLEAKADADHDSQMAMLDERRRMVTLLISDQAHAAELLEAIERRRLELLKAAEDAIKAQLDAMKSAESEAHRLVMAQFDERQKALREEHDEYLAFNKLRRDAIEEQRDLAEDAHDARMDALDAEAAALQATFDAEDRRLSELNVALERIKLGGEITAAQARLLREAGIDPDALEEAAKQIKAQETLLDAFTSLLSKIPDSDRPTRVKVTDIASDAEKAALQQALDQGLIDPEDRRVVEVALAGWGVAGERLREILTGVTDGIEKTADAAEGALSPMEQAEGIIALAENAQKSARLLLDDQLAAIDTRRVAEEEAWELERGRFEGRIAAITAADEASKVAFDRERQAIEDAKAAEADRHTTRMAQIEAEAALELLRLGHSEEEVQRILAEQRAAAERIASEAALRWGEAMREINTRSREAREETEKQAQAAKDLEAWLQRNPPPSQVEPVPGTPGAPIIDPGGPPSLPPPPGAPEIFGGAFGAMADSAGADAAGAWGDVADEGAVLADSMGLLADSAALVGLSLDPALDRMIDMLGSAEQLRDIMAEVASFGPGGEVIAAGGNLFIFQGPVTLDAEFAEEHGFLSALGTGP